MTDSLSPAFVQNARLGRGINMGNMLEAPRGGWNSEELELKPEYFRLIREKGFDSVRIPTRWSDYAESQAPYAIEPAFFDKVDPLLDAALNNNLAVVLNTHHYEEIFTHPAEHKERLLGLWAQIAERYKAYPNDLVFEVLNEPHGELTNPIWNDMADEAVELIRQTNPARTIMLGPGAWNSFGGLEGFELPQDNNLILTVHYYLPMMFTHQGASWAAGSDAWMGTKWSASEEEQQTIINDFNSADAWARERNLPVYLGEFGAYSAADMESRSRWTAYITKQAEARGWAWAYWEFCAGFGAYDPDAQQWREPLLKALIP